MTLSHHLRPTLLQAQASHQDCLSRASWGVRESWESNGAAGRDRREKVPAGEGGEHGKDRWELLDAAVPEAHFLMFPPWTANKKHSLPEASLNCGQTMATVSLVLLSSLPFLPTGPGPN